MKIRMVTDSLAQLSLDELLPTAAEVGIETLEFCCGNWHQPHCHDVWVACRRAR